MKKMTLISLILILICITSVYATENKFDIEVKTSSNNITKDQKQVTIDLYLKNYQGNGSLGYEAKLEYDKNVFESATITALNDWDNVQYDNTTGKFVSTKAENVENNTNIAKITLNLKESVTVKETTVKISDLIISDGDDSNTINKTITYNFLYNVKQEETTQEKPNIEIDTNISPKPETPKQLTVESVQKTKIDNTKAQTTIPQTGPTAVGTIIASIVILLGIIGYVKYRSIPLK